MNTYTVTRVQQDTSNKRIHKYQYWYSMHIAMIEDSIKHDYSHSKLATDTFKKALLLKKVLYLESEIYQ